MNLFLVTILFLFSGAAAAHLQERQACYEDNCLRAVNGTQRGPNHPVTGRANCTDYMTTTILEDPITTTTTETICFTRNPTASDFITLSGTPGPRRAEMKMKPHLEARATTAIPTHGPIPYYASACTDEHYSSACSCLGVEPATITQVDYTVTRTITIVTTDLTGSCSSRFPTSTSSTTTATLSNSPSSVLTTSSTFSITLSFNSSTASTIITLSSLSNSSTGTIPSSISSPWSNSSTTSSTSSSSPVCTTDNTTYVNATTSFTPSSTSTYWNTTTSLNATSTLSSTTDTASSLSTTSDIFPSPTSCSGVNVRLCNGTCSDLSTDIQNCGACNRMCSSGHECTNGVCTRPACDSTCLTQRGCGPANSTCICGAESGGAGVCFQGSGLCNDFDNCIITADCELGFVCVPVTCCGRGKCLNTQGCGRQGSLASELGPVREVGGHADVRIGEMNLLGGYLV